MICISVTPVSRKFAKVDLLNAAGQCDIIELCLDRLVKPPDMKDLLTVTKKPVLVSCRTRAEGGHWDRSEEERTTLLREAIVAGPAYVELDFETAKKIPKFGETKRVISYTSLDRPLSKVDDVFDQAAKLKADVVKFTWPTPTLEAAWPLLHAVSKKRSLPVVGLGIGTAGTTFSLLGRKYGSPWIYAALEKGMEAFEGQPTVFDLDDVYYWRDISSSTRFIGLVGFGGSATTSVRLINSIFVKHGVNSRCLPIISKKFDKLKQMLEILKVNGILTNRESGDEMLPLAEHYEEGARLGQYADLILKQDDGWHAYNSIWRSVIRVLEKTLGKSESDPRPLDKRNILVIGSSGLAQSIVYGLSKRKGLVSVSAPRDDDAQRIAQILDIRFIRFQNLYDTLADIVIFAEPSMKMGNSKKDFNPSFLRSSMVVGDVGCMPEDSELIVQARERGCKVLEPSELYAVQLATQLKSVTGKEIGVEELKAALE